jgi:hypothetical protein
MRRQLGPSMFFVIFTMKVNNWPELIKMLEELYIYHNHNNDKISKNVKRPKISKLVKMDPSTYA